MELKEGRSTRTLKEMVGWYHGTGSGSLVGHMEMMNRREEKLPAVHALLLLAAWFHQWDGCSRPGRARKVTVRERLDSEETTEEEVVACTHAMPRNWQSAERPRDSPRKRQARPWHGVPMAMVHGDTTHTHTHREEEEGGPMHAGANCKERRGECVEDGACRSPCLSPCGGGLGLVGPAWPLGMCLCLWRRACDCVRGLWPCGRFSLLPSLQASTLSVGPSGLHCSCRLGGRRGLPTESPTTTVSARRRRLIRRAGRPCTYVTPACCPIPLR